MDAVAGRKGGLKRALFIHQHFVHAQIVAVALAGQAHQFLIKFHNLFVGVVGVLFARAGFDDGGQRHAVNHRIRKLRHQHVQHLGILRHNMADLELVNAVAAHPQVNFAGVQAVQILLQLDLFAVQLVAARGHDAASRLPDFSQHRDVGQRVAQPKTFGQRIAHQHRIIEVFSGHGLGQYGHKGRRIVREADLRHLGEGIVLGHYRQGDQTRQQQRNKRYQAAASRGRLRSVNNALIP